jgi:hypothetical protein
MNRADLAGRIDAVEHRMDSIEHRLDTSFAALSTQIVQSHRETRDEVSATLRGEMRAMGEELRGEMRAIGEELRGETQAMGEDLHEEMYALHALANDRFDKLEVAVAESRRHTLILHEEVLSRIALLGEGRRS